MTLRERLAADQGAAFTVSPASGFFLCQCCGRHFPTVEKRPHSITEHYDNECPNPPAYWGKNEPHKTK